MSRETKEDDTPTMYIVVNNDLGMSKGKTASQVGHVVCDLTIRLVGSQTVEYKDWRREGQAKVVLKATENTIENLYAKYYKDRKSWCLVVHDAGKTQIAANSLTVLGFPPLYQKDVPEELKKLKLL